MVISPSARTVLADLSRPQVYHREWTVGRLLADMSSASRFDHAQIGQIIFCLSESILTSWWCLLCYMVRFTFHGTVAALKQKFGCCLRFIVRSMCVIFGRTIEEYELAMPTATCRFRFANLERVVCSPCSLTSRHCSTAPRELSPAICHMHQVTFAASVHLILLIACPVIHAVEQRLTRRYDLIEADYWRFGNLNERFEEEMMTQNSVAGANEVASISLESLRHTSSNPAILGVCSATLAPLKTRSSPSLAAVDNEGVSCFLVSGEMSGRGCEEFCSQEPTA
jgi:hypothetical protein